MTGIAPTTDAPAEVAPSEPPDTPATRRAQIVGMIAARERPGGAGLLLPLLLGPLTLFALPVVLALRRFERHLRDFDADAGALPPPDDPRASDAFARLRERAADRRGLRAARWLTLIPVGLGALCFLWMPVVLATAEHQDGYWGYRYQSALFGSLSIDDALLGLVVTGGYAITLALLSLLWWLHGRFRRHEEQALLAWSLAARAEPARVRERLDELRGRWLWRRVAAVALTLLALVPVAFGIPLLLYPLVLVMPLRAHARGLCPPPAGDTA